MQGPHLVHCEDKRGALFAFSNCQQDSHNNSSPCRQSAADAAAPVTHLVRPAHTQNEAPFLFSFDPGCARAPCGNSGLHLGDGYQTLWIWLCASQAATQYSAEEHLPHSTQLTQEQPHCSDLRDAGHHSHGEGVERSVADQQTDQQQVLLQAECSL